MPARGPSRINLTIRSLLIMGGFGAFLAGYNIYTSNRDVHLALGPQSDAQEHFFVDAADRPDIKVFYRKLTDPQKVQVAENIGRYTDAPLAKLCATLLGDFSAEARTVLTKSLTNVGQVHPDAVAAQLAQTGSFEAFGVRQALTNLGQAAVPDVVKTLGADATRQNAEDLLVSEGQRTIPVVMPLLSNSDEKVRIAAVTILGKLRADAALDQITKMDLAAQGAARAPYLGAIASIGDPKSEGLLSAALTDTGLSPNVRTQAALGLGRIASTTSVANLWKFAQSPDSTIAQGSLSALSLCKDKALVQDGEPEGLRLQVAGTIDSPASDALIRHDLENPAFRLAAISASNGREQLSGDLATLLSSPQNDANGDIADSAIKALLSTKTGKDALSKFQGNALLSGLIRRRETLSKES